MKKAKKTILISVTGLLIILASLPVMISYANYRSIKINNENEKPFIHHLNAVIQQKDNFHMTEVTTFDWDHMYMFPPYFSWDEMKKTVGAKWTTESSYFSYMMNELVGGGFPLLDESNHMLVFEKAGKVVLDVTLDRGIADFTGSDRVVEKKGSAFVVHKTEDLFNKISHASKAD